MYSNVNFSDWTWLELVRVAEQHGMHGAAMTQRADLIEFLRSL